MSEQVTCSPNLTMKFFCTLRPVSYTHLDVYKRQVKECITALIFFKIYIDITRWDYGNETADMTVKKSDLITQKQKNKAANIPNSQTLDTDDNKTGSYSKTNGAAIGTSL